MRPEISFKKLTKFKRTNNIEASKVICWKVFQISGLSKQQFILRQIFIFRSSAKIIIIFAQFQRLTLRAWATCGCSQAFSVELKNKKRVELPKMRHLVLMGGKGAGLMKMSEKDAVGSGTLTRPVLRSSPIHWLRVSSRFLIFSKFVGWTYLRRFMKMTTM